MYAIIDAMRLLRLVALLPSVCGRAVSAIPVRTVLATSSSRYFSDEGDVRGQHQHREGASERDEEARNRARRLSLATGSAVAALGAAYVLYNNQFKLKAQAEVSADLNVDMTSFTSDFYKWPLHRLA